MNNSTINIVLDIVKIVLGVWLVSYHKSLGIKTMNFWNKLVAMRVEAKGYQVGFLIFGICSIALGFLSLVGIIHFRK